MKHLTDLDAAFLHLETPHAHMHVVGTLVLDPSTIPAGYERDAFRQRIATRLASLPLFRQHVVEVPLDIDRPAVWEDRRFEVEDHFHLVTATAPGSSHELAEIVSRVAAVPLNRDRPLWQVTLVDGLASGHVAFILKIHHALIDGVSGSDLMALLLDLEPSAETPSRDDSDDQSSATWPGLEIVSDAARAMFRRPAERVRALAHAGTSVARAGLSLLGEPFSNALPTLPFAAPKTSFNRAISADRTVAFASASLEDLKFIKNTFKVTVNDVVLAACTRALQRYLASRSELPDRPLVASVPVSVRPDEDHDTFGNQVSVMFVGLPVHLDDAIEQLRIISEDSKAAKALQKGVGAHVVGDLLGALPAPLLKGAAQMYSRTGMADRMGPVHNLVISNVCGPPFPLFFAGARLVAAYPIGPILDGAGLNITVFSRESSIDVGVMSCPKSMRQPSVVAIGFARAVEELREVAKARTA